MIDPMVQEWTTIELPDGRSAVAAVLIDGADPSQDPITAPLRASEGQLYLSLPDEAREG